jgi:hypothetical protein
MQWAFHQSSQAQQLIWLVFTMLVLFDPSVSTYHQPTIPYIFAVSVNFGAAALLVSKWLCTKPVKDHFQ